MFMAEVCGSFWAAFRHPIQYPQCVDELKNKANQLENNAKIATCSAKAIRLTDTGHYKTPEGQAKIENYLEQCKTGPDATLNAINAEVLKNSTER